MTDGLSQLAQRGRRTRDIPPPRNPARTEPVPFEPTPAQPTGHSQPTALRADSAVVEAGPHPVRTPAPAKSKVDLKVVTIYLEQNDDDFLETITHTGRTSHPKTAISRSAVVRLALERLHAQLTPDEIITELRPRGDQQQTGRKRR